ncbi:hypothetical protein [Kribbella ginsengisoli]|uniref:HTH iclR-type domain-containing protein n=1 Tax=Kribbella ginsengisoli TaxID=363865 RepID=A0ABP6Z9B0_9ACTN
MGAAVAIGSAFFVTAAIGDLAAGESETPRGVVLAILVVFLCTCAGGGWLAIALLGPRDRKRRAEDELEAMILDLSRAHGGRVTAVEVASHCDVTVKVAKGALSRLCGDGVASAELTESGVMVYRMDFLPSSPDL